MTVWWRHIGKIYGNLKIFVIYGKHRVVNFHDSPVVVVIIDADDDVSLVRRIWPICAFGQMRSAFDQLVKRAAFDQMRNVW